MPLPRKYPVMVKFPKAENEPVEILVHGPIGKSFWDEDGISAKDFTNELKKIPAGRKITLGINSQGGGVGEGLAIYNAIERRAGDITARIDGYALSIASVLPLAAHKVVSPESSIWMIHNAHMMSAGNAAEHRKDADLLDKHDGVIVKAYAAKTGKTDDEIKKAMADETWFSGSEAKAWGLSDETTEEEPALNSFDFTIAPRDFFKSTTILAQHQGQQPPQPKEPTMNKTKILALLKARGVELPADASDEVIYAALEKASTPEAAPAKKTETDPSALIAAQLVTLQTELARMKHDGIARALDKCVLENRITKAQAKTMLPRCIADAALLEEIQSYEPVQVGADPVLNVAKYGVEGGLDKIKAEHKTPLARYQALKADWKNLLEDANVRDRRQHQDPMMSNTYSGTLVTSFLIDGSVTDLQNRWAMLNSFSRDYDPDPYKPLATGVLKHVTVGATAQTNATNFESGDSTVAPVSVTTAQKTVSFNVSNSDLNSGLRMENLVTINAAVFANTVIETVTAPITVANFGAAAVASAAAAFSFSDLATLQGALKKSPIKNLILDGTFIARIANTPGFFQTTGVVGGGSGAWKAFGWDMITQNTDWTGTVAGDKVQGFACNPQAIIVLAGRPLTPANIPGGILSEETFVVPEVNVTVTLYKWFNPSTRIFWCSYDIVVGAAAVDKTAGFIVAST